MRADISGKRANLVFDSMFDLVSALKARPDILNRFNTRTIPRRGGPNFFGADAVQDLFPLALNGAPGDGIEAMAIAQDKVATLEREVCLPTFASYYDVCGSDVDVARFLSGEPENMINYQVVDTPSVGRIISIVVSVGTSHIANSATIRERGMQIVALVLAIEKIGYQVELWADALADGASDYKARIRTRLKAPGDVMDAGQVVYAFTHASFFRCLVLAAMHMLPKEWHEPLQVGTVYGYYPPRAKDDCCEYADGALFIPAVHGNAEDPAALVLAKLRELQIIA